MKPRQLLTALLLTPNRIVSIGCLVDALWGDEPPRSAAQNLRTYATVIRRNLVGTECGLTTSQAGFRLRLPPGRLDSEQFAVSVTAARVALADERTERAVTLFTDALDRWRGPAGQGLPRDSWLGAALGALDEQRLTVLEERAEAQLRLGQHREVAAVLPRLVGDHPLRERMWRLLMLAQYRSGAVGAALESYTHARSCLVEHLGVEPDQELQALHRAILRRDPELAPPADSVAPARPPARTPGPVTTPTDPCPPRHLPAPHVVFVGRDRTLAELADLLAQPTPGRAVTLGIHGTAGIGKSALALQVAHAAARHFPDGQFYVDMRDDRDADGDVSIVRTVHRVLRAAGQAGPLPGDFVEAAALLRSCLAGRRVLTVLDNAASAAHVSALLPAHEGSAAIVTSQPISHSPALSHTTVLAPLDRSSAMQVVEGIIGIERASAARAAVADIVDACAGLPLALTAAATRLAARTHWPVETTRDRLLPEHRRIAELSLGEISVRRSLDHAVNEASARHPQVVRTLARLSRFRVPFDLGMALHACQEPAAETEAVLETLVDFGLLSTAPPHHYRLPDLIRLFAAELRPVDGNQGPPSGLYVMNPDRCITRS
ncbi:BTAD domain-containing putative transcriptional regulator [Micromonospora coxensis]|nr:BTAD domain-containing putative transcriptional regulator [Micromonospora coxensis]